ncbi:MAG: tetratricopeptide repeat protein [Proteobacteria bacterium]|nr:tetratricopeptide repeat protein [Pseudomonadota bacterium]MBU1639746.1 tetratricopeptide repeat protein [Pseudomonadota bacterium]
MSLCLCGAFIISLFLSHAAVAADTTILQRQGVKAYQEGNYDQALNLFSQAVAKEPDNATALYNQGTALYKQGRFDEASQTFSASAGIDINRKTRAKAEYNQGRALLAEAGTHQEPDTKKELLLAGNQAFQQALRDDPRLLAARKGIEDFRQELAKVKEQETKAKQDQQQQGDKGQDQGQQDQSAQGQGQQDLKDQLSEAGQQQQDIANQSKKAGSGQGKEGPGKQQREEMAAQQQSVRQSLEQIKDELQKNQQGQDGTPDNKELTKELDQAIQAQKKAEEALKKGDLSQAQQHQQQAADSLREMAADQKDKAQQSADAAGADDKQNEQPQDTSAMAKDQASEQDLEAKKIENTVADILDGEKALHEMRRLRMQQQRPASGKDW